MRVFLFLLFVGLVKSQAGIGEECTDQSDCSHLGYALCNPSPTPQNPNRKICQCGPEESFYDQICYKYLKFNEECQVPKQCEKLDTSDPSQSLTDCSPLTNSSITPVCHCSENGVPVGQGESTQCWLKIYSDQVPCVHDEQCVAANSSCVDVVAGLKRCQCKADHVDVDPTEILNCIPIAYKPGEPCQGFDQVCQEGMGDKSECHPNSGYCVCQGGTLYYYLYPKDKCFAPKGLGQYCASTGECRVVLGKFSKCDEETERCRCYDNAITANGKCWERKTVGSSCETSEECQVAIDGSVWCDFIGAVRGTCKCTSGSSADLGGTTCSEGSKLGTHIGAWLTILFGAIMKIQLV